MTLLTDQYKYYGSPKRRKEKGTENLKKQWLKIISEERNPNQKCSITSAKMNSKSTLRHIVIKPPKVKDKDRILKAASEKQIIMYKGIPIKLSTISHQKYYMPERNGLIKSKHWKKKLPIKILHLEKLSFKNDKGQTMTYPYK